MSIDLYSTFEIISQYSETHSELHNQNLNPTSSVYVVDNLCVVDGS